MRNIILLVVFIPSILFSQSDSTRLDFYPLQIGNEWTYQSYCWEYSSTGIDTVCIDTVSCIVTGDTIMPNGKKYYCISGIFGGFRRIDTLTQMVYEYSQSEISPDQEYILYDLSIVDSLNWIDGLGNCVEIKTTTDKKQVGYLNENAIQIIYSGRYFFHYQVLSQGFGLSRLHFGCTLPEAVHILIKAKINGIEYKPITYLSRLEWIIPPEFELLQNYPNPFNSNTTIKYQLPTATDVKLEIYNLRGQRIRTLVDQFQRPGAYLINWDGTDDFHHPVASGVYLYQFKTNSNTKMNKLILLR